MAFFDNLKSLRDQFFRVPQGRSYVRILPPHPAARGLPIIKGGVHWLELDEHYLRSVGIYPIPCPRRFGETGCVLCDRVQKLSMSRDTTDWELAEELEAQPRYFANVVVSGEELKVWHFGSSVYYGIIGCMKRYGDITDPEKGRQLVVTREGSYMETRYRVSARRSASPLPAAVLAQLEEDPACLKDLRKLCRFLSDEDVREAYEWRYRDWYEAWHAPVDELAELAFALRDKAVPLQSDWDR